MSASYSYLIQLATKSAMDAAQGPDETFLEAKLAFMHTIPEGVPATERGMILRHWDLVWNKLCGSNKPAIDLGMVDA